MNCLRTIESMDMVTQASLIDDRITSDMPNWEAGSVWEVKVRGGLRMPGFHNRSEERF